MSHPHENRPDAAREPELPLPAELRELESPLRRAEERPSADLDRRVAALLAAAPASPASGTASAPVARPPFSLLRGRRTAAAAALLLTGGLVFALGREFGWFAPVPAPVVPERPDSRAAASPADPLAAPAVVAAPPAERSRAPELPTPLDASLADSGHAPAAAPDYDDCDPPQPTVLHLGFPMNVNAALTFERAPIVARLRTVGTHAVPCVHGGEHSNLRPLARIEHVYHGDPALVGRQIELHRAIGESARSFLAWGDGYPPTSGGQWVTAFALIDRPALPDGSLHAQQLLAEGYGGTTLSDVVPLTSGAPPRDRAAALIPLLHDLAASLGDRQTALGAVTALRQFDSGASPVTPPNSSVWRDPVACAALLAAAADPSPRVRWTVAWMNPAAAGPDGEERLLALAFDADPLVRQPALHWLSHPELSGLAADGAVALAARELSQLAVARADHPLDELLTGVFNGEQLLFDDVSLERHLAQLRAERDPDARRRALLALSSVQHGDAVVELLAGLGDGAVEVRRAAAFALATAGLDHGDAVCTRLHEVPDHEEATVQALVGYAELTRGSVHGFDRMERMLKSDTPAVREQVVQLLARAGARRLDPGDVVLVGDGGAGVAGLLLRAAGDADVVVRSRALLALARLSPGHLPEETFASEWESLVASADADSSALVRATARLARAEWIRTRTLSASERRLLERLGYGE